MLTMDLTNTYIIFGFETYQPCSGITAGGGDHMGCLGQTQVSHM